MEQVKAEELAESVACTMRTSSFNDEWMTTAPTQIQLAQIGPPTPTLEMDSDSEELPASSTSTLRGVNQYLLVNAAGKRGATLHNTDKCWMARSRSFTSLEVRTDMPGAGEYKRICKLCWPDNQMVQEQESSSSDSDSNPQHSAHAPNEGEDQEDAGPGTGLEVLENDSELTLVEPSQEPVLVEEWNHVSSL